MKCVIVTLATSLMAACVHSHDSEACMAPVDVFVSGQGGYASYRIPSIFRLQGGDLLAFAEGRDSDADNGANDLVMRRSSDEGRSWTRIDRVLDLPGRSLNNPCVVQLTSPPHVGRVLLMFQSYPTGCGERCVLPGDDPERACLTLVMHSDDGGSSWSQPRELTEAVKRGPPVTSVAAGPGVGIQLRCGPNAGRVIIPFNQGPFGEWRVYAVYSDDGGDSWLMGANAPEDGQGHANEVQMAEGAEGSIVLVARQVGGPARRKIAMSMDGGATWNPLAPAAGLPDPSCMGGLISIDGADGTLVCTGPSSQTRRLDGRAWFSRDGGRTWPQSKPIWEGSFACSVPVQLGPDRIGVLFESDECARIRWITLPGPGR